jgi:hypothetical protein
LHGICGFRGELIDKIRESFVFHPRLPSRSGGNPSFPRNPRTIPLKIRMGLSSYSGCIIAKIYPESVAAFWHAIISISVLLDF